MIELGVPYQQVLRVVGAFLDAEGARSVRLVELKDGILVNYVLPGSPLVPQTRTFSYTDLASTDWDVQGQASRGTGGDGAVVGGVQYQDLLRAVGYELEQLGSYSIVLDQIEDNFLVTYQFYRAAEGFLLHKDIAYFGAADREKLIEKARSRRARIVEPKRGLLGRMAQ